MWSVVWSEVRDFAQALRALGIPGEGSALRTPLAALPPVGGFATFFFFFSFLQSLVTSW